MSEHVFYSTENDHHHRELTIVNAALLVSKPPTKEKRIRIKVRMLLSGQPTAGAPDWIDSHYAHVAQWHDPVSPEISFSGFDLHFSAQNLFDQEGVKSPRCQMRSFEIHECGDSESPDVALSFVIYAPFSGALWQWLGQFGGDACWCSFTPGVPGLATSSSDQPALTDGDGDGDGDEDDDMEDDDGEDLGEEGIDEEAEYDPDLGAVVEMPKKSGPRDLAAFHENVVQGEAIADIKRGRGRPRKQVDPLAVQTPQPF